MRRAVTRIALLATSAAAVAAFVPTASGSAAPTRAHDAVQPGWVLEARNGPNVAVDRREVGLRDGVRVDVIRFHKGTVTYALHAGSEDPGAAANGLKGGPAVSSSERPKLLAAFNGAFKLKAGTGGYMQEKRTISPLRSGYASLVIGPKGNATIVSWPTGAPAGAVSVRQNLTLLISGGRLSPQIDNPDGQVWGWTLSKKFVDARSAIATDAKGNLLYAASMSTSPRDLATALIQCGARTAMELDINPEWLQLDYAHKKGGPLVAALTGQARPANQFLSGFTRDFFTVLAAPLPPKRKPPVRSE
ncbi:MAG TPA: phosphodiester glycosidase family protein [Mycobacteriales bacterium]|nr:phosphodiester glycosidase family protein [Mycobacteriales bacterium]